MLTEGTVATGSSFTISGGLITAMYDKQLTKRLGTKVYFSKLGDPMAYAECSTRPTDSPLQSELNSLKSDILSAQQSIKYQQAMLLIARTKLAAVKKLVK